MASVDDPALSFESVCSSPSHQDDLQNVSVNGPSKMRAGRSEQVAKSDSRVSIAEGTSMEGSQVSGTSSMTDKSKQGRHMTDSCILQCSSAEAEASAKALAMFENLNEIEEVKGRHESF